MDGPNLDSSNKCSWCGTLDPAGSHTCSKCDAVLSSIQPSVVSASQTSERVAPTPAEESRVLDKGVITPLVDSPLFDKMTAQTMLSLGLGPPFESGQTRA